jgi:mono/diheme cytochrome c family protein
MPEYAVEKLSDEVLAEIFEFLAEQPQPTDGQGLYEDYCGYCHGPDAKSGTAEFDTTAHLHDLEPGGIIRKGANLTLFDEPTKYMPKWTAEELSDAEVALISDYISSLP